MDPTPYQRLLGPILLPASVAYGGLMAVRRWAWECGLLRSFVPTCPCISVGNIAWGGTGKTPLVDWLMGWSLRCGLKPVVLSRGYKADLSIVPMRVNMHHTAREAGDEPLMLSLAHPDADVLVDPDRRRAAQYALRSLQPDLLLLDDGFQHLAMGRNLDLVLLRPVDVLEQWNRVIPAGSWREGRSALSRAGAFLIKIAPERLPELLPALREKLSAFKRPVFSFSLQPTVLSEVGGQGTLNAEGFGRRPYVLVSGVGEPQQVYDTATQFLGQEPEHHFIFPDHHQFLFRDAKKISATGLPVLCTAKDAVKLRHILIPNLWCLRVETVFGPYLWSDVPFAEWWAARWATLSVQRVVLPCVPASCIAEDIGFNANVVSLNGVTAQPKDEDLVGTRDEGAVAFNPVPEENIVSNNLEPDGSQAVFEMSDSGDKSDEHMNVRSDVEKLEYDTPSPKAEPRTAWPGRTDTARTDKTRTEPCAAEPRSLESGTAAPKPTAKPTN